MKRNVLFIAFIAVLVFSACYATVSGGIEGDSGYWHCVNGFCHWHEYGVLEGYYFPFYGRPYYIAPPPPRIYITPRYHHYRRYPRRYSPPHYHRHHFSPVL